MDARPQDERRHGRRYLTGGYAVFRAEALEATAEVVNIGQLGILVRSDTIPAAGAVVSIQFTVYGYPAQLRAEGRVAGINFNLFAIKFLHDPSGLSTLLEWLRRENCSWVAMEDSDSCRAGHTHQNLPLPPLSDTTPDDEEMENIRAHLFGLG